MRGEGGAQQCVHLRGKGMMGMVQHHRATAAEQMRQTRLVRGLCKLAVGRPAVALQDAGIVSAEHGGGLCKTAPVLNRIDGRLRGHEGPEPLEVAADLPAGFMGRDDGTAADRRAEHRVGRLRLARGAMDGVDQSATRNGESEAIAQQLHDLAEGEAELFVEDHGQGNGLRAQLHGRGTQRIRGLQRMTALDAAVALPALTHRDAKFVHDGALHGEVFLVLRDDAAAAHRPATVRTRQRQRRVMRHIDGGGESLGRRGTQ